MKEALSIRTTLENARFNRDDGYELPECWIAMYKKLKGGASMRGTHHAFARPIVRIRLHSTTAAPDQACKRSKIN